jgi:hypothetical protein
MRDLGEELVIALTPSIAASHRTGPPDTSVDRASGQPYLVLNRGAPVKDCPVYQVASCQCILETIMP